MATSLAITAQNHLGSMLEEFPRRGEKIVQQISGLADEIAVLQAEVQSNSGLYDPGDIGLLNQVRAGIKSAIQQAAASI